MDPVLDDDSDGEWETQGEQKYSGKSGFVFLLDFRVAMFEGDDNNYFRKSLECCVNAMLQISREQRYDMVSIVLFGASKSEGKFAPPGVVLLQPLSTPRVSLIKKVKGYLEDGLKELVENYGHGETISVGEVLNYSKNLLQFCKTKLYTKSIVMFTYEDNPHSADDKSAHRARKRAEEIKGHGIEFDVVGLGEFDSSLFYKELVLTSRGELLKDWVGNDPIKNIDDVHSEISCLTKRATRHFGNFYFGRGVVCRVIFHKLFQEPTQKLTPSFMTQDMEETVEGDLPSTSGNPLPSASDCPVPPTTGGPVLSTVGGPLPSTPVPEKIFEVPELRLKLGGELLDITKSELRNNEIRTARGLTLIGFRPLSTIPLHMFIGEPYFVMADSSSKTGLDLFSHFLHSCLRKGVAPLCWFASTKHSSPVLTVLYPTEPAEYATGATHPHGFHLLKTFFSDMFNEFVNDLPEAECSQSQLEAASSIIKKTGISWTPDYFSDSEYKKRLAMVEAIAMEYESAEEVIDKTDIDLDQMGERISDFSDAFLDCGHLSPEQLGKREGSTSGSYRAGGRAKEVKIEDTVDLIATVKAGLASKLTVAQLKDILRAEGIKSLSSLSKPRLVALANERFNV